MVVLVLLLLEVKNITTYRYKESLKEEKNLKNLFKFDLISLNYSLANLL